MNTLLIKHINDAQQKMSAYLTLLDLRYRNLCVKADPIALLPVTIDSGDKDLNIEDVANVSVPNEYQLAVFPNEFSYMKDLIRGIFDAHPEFRLEIKDMNEESKEKLNNSDEEGPDLSELGLDKLLNQDNDETKYLLYTMPEVNKDRRDFLNNGVEALHQQCKVKLDAEYAAGLKRFREAEIFSTEKDMEEARQDLKDLLDDVKVQIDEKLQEKQKEIEEAYLHYLEEQANASTPPPSSTSTNDQDEQKDDDSDENNNLDYTKSMRMTDY
jgi:ribosome recycling factor